METAHVGGSGNCKVKQLSQNHSFMPMVQSGLGSLPCEFRATSILPEWFWASEGRYIYLFHLFEGFINIQVWWDQQVRKQLPLKRQFVTVPKEGTCHIMQDHIGKHQGESGSRGGEGQNVGQKIYGCSCEKEWARQAKQAKRAWDWLVWIILVGSRALKVRYLVSCLLYLGIT